MTSNSERNAWADRDKAWPRLRDAPLKTLADQAQASDAELSEYRRFLRLAEMFPGEVTPPSRLAAIWQIHDLDGSAEALGVPYDPRMGQGDIPVFKTSYIKVLRAYERYFGAPPDPAIWPQPQASLPVPSRGSILMACLLTAVVGVAQGWPIWVRGVLLLVALVCLLRAIRAHMVAGKNLR